MKSYDLYGVKVNEITSAKLLIEEVLGVTMAEHESSYHCGVYFRVSSLDTGEENFILQKNFDEYEKEWAEDDFRDYLILLYVNDTLRSKEITRLFSDYSELVLLSHQKL